MENTINISSNAVRSINKFMDKITDTCDQLIGALEVNKDGVSSYGVRITDKVMNSEFVDRVIWYLMVLKKYIFDLDKYSVDHFQDVESVKHIISHLLETSDKLKLKMIENSFFNNTYGDMVMEISDTIDNIILKMPAIDRELYIKSDNIEYKQAA